MQPLDASSEHPISEEAMQVDPLDTQLLAETDAANGGLTE
jgi:hypothetical protein